LLLLAVLLGAPVARADVTAVEDSGQDYAKVALFALPWACGEGHVITWDPQGHWGANKASGVAYDFRMATGTPLYAPADGVARFLRDDRPFDTNLGNYVDLVTLDGAWLIRMAHLEGTQVGERQVRMGDLLGHSGSSGVQVEHLHLELFVRSGSGWVAPDLKRLTRLFGLPRAEFFEGAMLTNDTCSTALVVAGKVTSLDAQAALGEAQRLQVTLRNDSLTDVPCDWVQISLFSPEGLAQVATAEGNWLVPARQSVSISVPSVLEAAGEWYVGRVTLREQGRVAGQPAEGTLSVTAPAVQVAAVMPGRALYSVGDLVSLDVLLRNNGTETWQADSLVVTGTQADGMPWEARLDGAITLAGGQANRFRLQGSFVPQQVGRWRAKRISYGHGDHQLVLGASPCSFGVTGVQLALEQVQAFSGQRQLAVLAVVQNVGSTAGPVDRLEAWGWQPDGETSFTISAQTGVMSPGEIKLIWLTTRTVAATGGWHLVDVGYWLRGTYYSAGLPRYEDRASAR